MLPQEDVSVEDMATTQAMNGGLPAAPVSGYIPAPPVTTTVTTVTTAPVTPSPNGSAPASATTAVASPPVPEFNGDYSAYVLNVNAPWPPPVFARPNLKPEERFYLENRWYSQWSFFDKKANESKSKYLRYQQVIVIGSVIVPVLVAFGPNFANIFTNTDVKTAVRFMIDVATVVVSTSVAASAAWEGLHKYGDSWTTYRRAAEEMQQEKYMFDVRGGRYANNTDAFSRFVERCEEVIAQQNGRFIQTIEKQQAQQQAMNDEILSKYREKGEVETTVTVSSPATSSVVAVETASVPTTSAPASSTDDSAG